jgi:hypothetical protein
MFPHQSAPLTVNRIQTAYFDMANLSNHSMGPLVPQDIKTHFQTGPKQTGFACYL